MRLRSRLLSPVAVLFALGAGLALASCGGDENASPTTTDTATTQTQTETQTETDTVATTETTPRPERPAVVRVDVRGGVSVGGIVRPKVDKGDRVVLLVRSDVADHVHVHGYDLFRDLVPGRRIRLAFRAEIPGRFEIELEDRHVQIAELTVNP